MINFVASIDFVTAQNLNTDLAKLVRIIRRLAGHHDIDVRLTDYVEDLSGGPRVKVTIHGGPSEVQVDRREEEIRKEFSEAVGTERAEQFVVFVTEEREHQI